MPQILYKFSRNLPHPGLTDIPVADKMAFSTVAPGVAAWRGQVEASKLSAGSQGGWVWRSDGEMISPRETWFDSGGTRCGLEKLVHLAWLITKRSLVRVQHPQLTDCPKRKPGGCG